MVCRSCLIIVIFLFQPIYQIQQLPVGQQAQQIFIQHTTQAEVDGDQTEVQEG